MLPASDRNSESQYRRLRQVESGLIPLLHGYAEEVLGSESLNDAWLDFNNDQPFEEFTPHSPMNMLFKPW